MGHHHRLRLILVPCFLAAILIISPFSIGVKEETLKIICSQTKNEEICVKILNKDSRTLSATLLELSLLSINLTRNQATRNFKNFQKLRDNSNTTPTLKNSYDRCLNLYTLMFQKISEAYDLSQKGKYKEITQLGEAQDLAYRCENGIPSKSSSTAAISQTMIITCEASASVNLYITHTFP